MSGLNYRGAYPTPDGVIYDCLISDWEEFGRWVAEALSPTDQARFLAGFAAEIDWGGSKGLTQLQEIGVDAERYGISEEICLLAENLAEVTRPRGEEA